MKKELRILPVLLVLVVFSCERTDYDLLFIHNHPPRLDITNYCDDGMLWVYGIEEIPSATVQGRKSLSKKFKRFGDTLYYMDEKTLPVEPGSFMVYLTDFDGTILADTSYWNVRRRDKHTEIPLVEP